jgi:ribosomal protein S18 acetylase RimI-like enzyme
MPRRTTAHADERITVVLASWLCNIECGSGEAACTVSRMSIFVRPATPADVDNLVALALRAWEPVHASMATVLGDDLNTRIYPDWAASQASDVSNACADPNLQVSVAIDAERVVGFVAVMIDSATTTGEVDMIAVDPASQGRGVGHQLTEHALSQMRDAGCDLAVIATGGDEGHATARALYESEGFTPLPLVRYYRHL